MRYKLKKRKENEPTMKNIWKMNRGHDEAPEHEGEEITKILSAKEAKKIAETSEINAYNKVLDNARAIINHRITKAAEDGQYDKTFWVDSLMTESGVPNELTMTTLYCEEDTYRNLGNMLKPVLEQLVREGYIIEYVWLGSNPDVFFGFTVKWG